jgi:hypothetical protein
MTLVEPDRPTQTPSFVDGLADHGDAVAVVTAERTLTYAELDEAVTSVAGALGAERRLVLVEAANTVGALVALLAALRGGHPTVLAAAGASVTGHPLTTAYDPDVVFRADAGWAPEERRAAAGAELHPDLALLLSTSGSTGSPKLVRLSRENLQANASAIVRSLGITASDRAVTTLPMQYCYGLSVVTSHLTAGAGLVLTDRSVVDERFWDLVRATGATTLAGVPHTFELLDRVGFPGMALPSLRTLTQAGGRLHPDTVRRYAALSAMRGWDLFVMYGQTEATARMAYLPPCAGDLAPAHHRGADPRRAVLHRSPGRRRRRRARLLRPQRHARLRRRPRRPPPRPHRRRAPDGRPRAADTRGPVRGGRSAQPVHQAVRAARRPRPRRGAARRRRHPGGRATGDDDQLVVAVERPDDVGRAARGRVRPCRSQRRARAGSSSSTRSLAWATARPTTRRSGDGHTRRRPSAA